MIKSGDIVIVTCDHPSGAIDICTKGEMGVVTETFEDPHDGYTLRVENRCGSFLYIESELRLATIGEKEAKLVDLLLL